MSIVLSAFAMGNVIDGWLGSPGATVGIVTAGGEGDVMEMGASQDQRLEAGPWEMCVGATVA